MRDNSYLNIMEFWTRKKIPYIFDETLSLYQLVRLTVKYLNEVIKDQNELKDAIKEFLEMFDENLKNEVIKEFDRLIKNGFLPELINDVLLKSKLDKEVFEDFELAAKTSLDITNASIIEFNDRVDNIIATPTTVSEQEIIDARQSETSLGANLTSIKKDLFMLEKPSGEWEQGNIIRGGDNTKDFDIRIRTKGFVDLKHGATIKSKGNYEFVLVKYDWGGTYLETTPWVNHLVVEPSSEYKYRLLLTKRPNTVITTDDHVNLIVKINAEQFEENMKETLFGDRNLLFVEKPSGEWEQGVIINGNNSPNNPDKRIRTKGFVDLKHGAIIEAFNDYDFTLVTYNLDETYVESTPWIRRIVVEPSSQYKYRLVLRKQPSLVITTDEHVNLIIKINGEQLQAYTDITTKEQIETYRLEEVKEVANRIKLNTREKSLCFPIIADNHTKKTTKDRFAKTCKNIQMVAEECSIDGIINLGDMIDGNMDFDDEKEMLEFSVKQMRKVDKNLFIVKGNHDDISYGTHIADGTWLSNEELYSITQRQNELKVKRNDNKLYYYKDYDTVKVRFIYLDSVDVALGFAGQGWGYGDEQIEWFTTEALNTDYHVVVFSHVAPSTNLIITNQIRGAYDVLQALEEWQTNDKRVIGVISGHTHADKIDTTSRPFPQVILANNLFAHYTTNIPDGAVSPARTMGTVTEDLWDTMVIKLESQEVKFIRFGAGEDATVSFAP